MARNKRTQSEHDREVKKNAQEFIKKGFDVKADISGFRKPDTIGGFRPDIIAKKGSQKKIVEVETPDSAKSKRDQNQQKAFRKEANKSDKTTFRRIITKKK